jgi:[ribosomal protein S5]-alanine N-acetyltransferase
MIEIKFTPFPVLTTDRLILRQLLTTDDSAIFVHRSDDLVNKYLEGFRHSSIEETRAFIDRVQNEVKNDKTILWVITEKGNDRFIGTVCLWNISREEDKAETGYTLVPAFQRKGYMNEALAKVIDFGFNTMKLRTIEAYTHKDNKGSIQLLIKNKFLKDTTCKIEDKIDRVIFKLNNESV